MVAIITGTNTDNVLAGTAGADTISGLAGNDTLTGGGGGDLLLGGTGRDLMDGGDGNDLLFGDFGGDMLLGGAGNDVLDGGADDDVVSGGDGSDVLYGSGGGDVLNGGAGTDFMSGGAGNDLLRWGVTYDEFLAGKSAAIGGIFGGTGYDVFENIQQFANSTEGKMPVEFGPANGIEEFLNFGVMSAPLYGAPEHWDFSGVTFTGYTQPYLVGTTGDDTIIGGISIGKNTTGQVFKAGAGADQVTGGGGIDMFVFTTQPLWNAGGLSDLVKTTRGPIDEVFNFHHGQDMIYVLTGEYGPGPNGTGSLTLVGASNGHYTYLAEDRWGADLGYFGVTTDNGQPLLASDYSIY